MHFLRLRLDDHAQYEIRVYGEAMANIVKEIVPVAWEAFEDYHLNSVTFSAKEGLILKKLIDGENLEEINFEDAGLRKREEREFKEKYNKIIK
jgi:thymidylate synthase (FAD)